MSFVVSDLSVLAYANNFTLWHYVTSDDDILESGYFNSASGMLNANDLIMANVDIHGDTPVTKFYVVTGNDGADVEVAVYS